MRVNRRRVLAGALTAGAATLGSGLLPACSRPPGRHAPRVVVIGGGYGGATCARYIRHFDPDVEVTLVEAGTRYFTCPFSNAVLGGLQGLSSISLGYDALEKNHGVRVIHARADTIYPEKTGCHACRRLHPALPAPGHLAGDQFSLGRDLRRL